MDKDLIKDIISWDVSNWSKAIPFWEGQADLNSRKLKCLELGGRSGGLSLWLAQKGHEVICSDLNNPESFAKALHDKYKTSTISYQAINALHIPYENEFDIVVFKSVLGGISRGGKNEYKKKSIEQMHKALKAGGKLLFAENLEASSLHRFFRKNFVSWGSDWNYLKISEVEPLFSNFKSLDYKTTGFLGTFGRSEVQRNFLGKIDSVFECLLSANQHYIVFGVAEK